MTKVSENTMICPGCGERVMIDYDPILKRWNCAVCGWSWIWRPIMRGDR